MNYPDCKDKNSFNSGIEFEDYVCCALAREGIIIQNIHSKTFQYQTGENLQGFEIKLDRYFIGTGRLSIEVAEKTRADDKDWIPSGIYRKDRSWLYIQGNYERIYIFQKSILILLHRSERYKEDQTPTVKKFYLPIKDAEKYCAKKIEINQHLLSMLSETWDLRA
jgi:hypothetical protein